MAPSAREHAALELAAGAVNALEPVRSSSRLVVAAYLSTGTEPGTHHMLPALTAAGFDVVVPVCEPGFGLNWAPWHEDVQLEPSDLAPLLEPVGPRLGFTVMERAAAVLIPALAVDTLGNRLGQGGGYYDRFLTRLRLLAGPPPALGVVFEHELVEPETFESSELDVPLDGALTPRRWLRFLRQ